MFNPAHAAPKHQTKPGNLQLQNSNFVFTQIFCPSFEISPFNKWSTIKKCIFKLGPRRRVVKIVASDLNRLCGFSYRSTYVFFFLIYNRRCVNIVVCMKLSALDPTLIINRLRASNLFDHIFQKSGLMSFQTPPKFFGSVFFGRR